MKRLLVADDHEAVRSGLRAVLEERPDWEVVAEAEDGRTAIAAAMKSRPHVAIVDYLLPGMTGIEVTRRIKTLPLETEVLIFTVHDSPQLADQARRAGAGAFLIKSEANKRLVAAVDSLLQHRAFPVSEDLHVRFGVTFDRDGRRESVLTAREELIVKLVTEGHSNKRIGSVLDISEKTVETYRAAAMRKLGVKSIVGLVRFAVRAKLVDP